MSKYHENRGGRALRSIRNKKAATIIPLRTCIFSVSVSTSSPHLLPLCLLLSFLRLAKSTWPVKSRIWVVASFSACDRLVGSSAAGCLHVSMTPHRISWCATRLKAARCIRSLLHATRFGRFFLLSVCFHLLLHPVLSFFRLIFFSFWLSCFFLFFFLFRPVMLFVLNTIWPFSIISLTSFAVCTVILELTVLSRFLSLCEKELIISSLDISQQRTCDSDPTHFHFEYDRSEERTEKHSREGRRGNGEKTTEKNKKKREDKWGQNGNTEIIINIVDPLLIPLPAHHLMSLLDSIPFYSPLFSSVPSPLCCLLCCSILFVVSRSLVLLTVCQKRPGSTVTINIPCCTNSSVHFVWRSSMGSSRIRRSSSCLDKMGR